MRRRRGGRVRVKSPYPPFRVCARPSRCPMGGLPHDLQHLMTSLGAGYDAPFGGLLSLLSGLVAG